MYTLDFNIDPSVVAGEPVKIQYSVKKKRKAVKDLQKVHERVSHLIIISKDLQFFDHVHADFNPGTGLFSIRYIFPTKGMYVLFADYTPKETGATQVERHELEVQDIIEEGKNHIHQKTRFEDVITVHQQIEPADPKPGDDARLIYRLKNKSGEKDNVNDIEPYLGAPGHLIIISENTQLFLHAHPEVPGVIHNKKELSHSRHTDNRLKRFGPDLIFHTRFPASGLYKIWLEFVRKGTLYRKEFEKTVHDT